MKGNQDEEGISAHGIGHAIASRLETPLVIGREGLANGERAANRTNRRGGAVFATAKGTEYERRVFMDEYVMEFNPCSRGYGFASGAPQPIRQEL